MVKVTVKWQKQTFNDLEIDISQPPILFKGQLFALTGVLPERQKIMVKGGVLQDDGDWSKLGIKEGQKLMMMGTAEALPEAPTNVPVFLEDLPEEEREGHSNAFSSAGLTNLGNTCYMNSTLQCLHSIPQLKSALSSYSPADGIDSDSSHKLTLATSDLFSSMGSSKAAVTPMRFLQLLRNKYPQFAQQGEHGSFMQQDAEECWSQILFSLSQRLRSKDDPSASVPKQLFELELTSSISCDETADGAAGSADLATSSADATTLASADASKEGGASTKVEEAETEIETSFSLKCHITSDVNQLHEGLKGGLTSKIEKTSPRLGRSAIFTKQSHISRLPPYLTVQFVRFFWKRESQQKAKILRKVGFPLVLDIYDLCTPELRRQLDGPRKALRLEDEAAAGLRSSGEKKKAEGDEKEDGEKAGADSAVVVVEKKDAELEGVTGTEAAAGEGGGGGDVEMAEATEAPADTLAVVPPSNPASNLSGFYELVSVLTHKGRSADSGHYVAWVKQPDGRWVEFDDEEPILRKEEEIIKLSGGGDWHMAYILVYKARTPKGGAE